MRHANWFTGLFVGLICLGGLTFESVTSASSPKQSTAGRKTNRRVAQSRIEEIKRHNLNLNNLRSAYIDGTTSSLRFDRSILRDAPRPDNAYSKSSGAPPPPPSPGIMIARSSYDYQSNTSAGYQTARVGGADIVHFVWMAWDRNPSGIDDDRSVSYNSYSISGDSLLQSFGGSYIGLGVLARAGYPAGDVWDDNSCQAVLHQRGDVSFPYSPWSLSFPIPGALIRIEQELGGYNSGGCPEVLWPRIAASRDGSRTSHVLAHSNINDCLTDLLWYWRYNGTDWTGPVIIDSTPQISYALADDPTGDKLAIAVHLSNYTSMNGINNVAYLESTTDGAGWIAGTEAKTKNVLTSYNSDAGPGAWLHLAACYDHDGTLHIAFDEQLEANDSPQAAIRHWNSQRQTIRTVAIGNWDTPDLTGVFDLNLAKLTMGIGDGSTMCQGGIETNENYVYLLYTRFGGPTQAEQDDHSLEGRYNGELYLSASNSGGNTWASPVNLTNTKTPNCNPGVVIDTFPLPPYLDSVCRSEHWATIGMVVSDIDIFFISDLDAGGIPQGEGTWQLNPVHYLRIPGGTTDALHVCPLITPNLEATLSSDIDCEYNATQLGQNVETLTIMNLGNADLNGTITVTDFPGTPTLTVAGAGPYTIPGGAPDLIKTVTMASNSAPEGLYTGQIAINHNDASEASPRVFPIEFFVFNQFFCPQSFPSPRTGVGGPNGLGSLFLEVQSNGSFASQNPEGGLWRYADSSSSIFDATLLIAHGPQDTDTTVFLRFYSRATNGQYGFRALSDLIVDVTAQGTGAGCATASSRMCTKDSVVGITVEWYYPQSYSEDEFIVARYKFYRHDPLIPVTALAIGILADLDVLPASRYGTIQNGMTNKPGSDGSRNLVWVRGVDTAGHFPTGQNTATRFRGGIVVPDGFEGAIVGNAGTDIQPGGGPTDGFLYYQLQNLAGIDLYSVSDTDLYLTIALAKDRSIAAGETLSYSIILLSDTISEASLKATADAAIAALPYLCGLCSCPCKYDPQCDGVYSNIQDVVKTIDVAFRGTATTLDQDCPIERTDVDATGITNVADVVKVVNVAFRGQTVAANYVDPCGA